MNVEVTNNCLAQTYQEIAYLTDAPKESSLGSYLADLKEHSKEK